MRILLFWCNESDHFCASLPPACRLIFSFGLALNTYGYGSVICMLFSQRLHESSRVLVMYFVKWANVSRIARWHGCGRRYAVEKIDSPPDCCHLPKSTLRPQWRFIYRWIIIPLGGCTACGVSVSVRCIESSLSSFSFLLFFPRYVHVVLS